MNIILFWKLSSFVMTWLSLDFAYTLIVDGEDHALVCKRVSVRASWTTSVAWQRIPLRESSWSLETNMTKIARSRAYHLKLKQSVNIHRLGKPDIFTSRHSRQLPKIAPGTATIRRTTAIRYNRYISRCDCDWPRWPGIDFRESQ